MAFDNNKLGELRPNQIITTFGPGSVVDAVKDSVTILKTMGKCKSLVISNESFSLKRKMVCNIKVLAYSHQKRTSSKEGSHVRVEK